MLFSSLPIAGKQVKDIRSRVEAGEQKSKLAEEYRVSRRTLYTAIRYALDS